MHHFSLFAHGESFDPPAFLASTTLAFDEVWTKGESGGNHPKSSGVRKTFGDGWAMTVREQEHAAADYLAANRDALKALAAFPGVTTFNLGLHVAVELDDSITGFCCCAPSARLMWHALDVGVELFYPVTLSRRPRWEPDPAPHRVAWDPARPGGPPRTVLVTAGVLVEAPHDDDAMHRKLDEVSDEVRAAVRLAAAAQPGCTPVDGSSYHYLDDDNAARCDRCREWTTDTDKPDWVHLLNWGRFHDGRFLCEQCRIHLMDAGELARPGGP